MTNNGDLKIGQAYKPLCKMNVYDSAWNGYNSTKGMGFINELYVDDIFTVIDMLHVNCHDSTIWRINYQIFFNGKIGWLTLQKDEIEEKLFILISE